MSAGLANLRGMDTAAGLSASGHLDEGSQAILDIAGRLDQALAAFDWTGTDADRTRDVWASDERPALDATAQALAAMAVLIRQEAEAQDRASGESASGGAGGTVGTPAAGSGGVLGFLRNAAAFVGDRVVAGLTGIGRGLGHSADVLGKIVDVVTGREDHSLVEIAASALAAGGSQVGELANIITGEDQRWFADGPGMAGTPAEVPTAPGTGTAEHPVLSRPTDLPTLMQGVTDAYQAGEHSNGEVRITRVDNGSGPAYVVNVPGTERWWPDAGPVGRDLSANIGLVAGNPTAAAESVTRAMEAAGIPPGAPVMLVGHSQGGIIAAQLASDPAFVERFGVTNVMTYGAPIDHMQLAPGVEGLQVQHRFDLVPRLDLGGVDLDGVNPNSEVRTVVLDSPGGLFGLGANHSHSEYRDSVRAALGGDSEAGRILRDYQSTLTPFLVTPTGQASAVDVPVWRGR